MQILLGLLDYRDALRGTGFLDGHQWLTGSFVEAIEREPNDVDVVNFLHVPFVSIPATAMPLFRSQDTKATYHCDAYTIPLSYPSGHSVTPEQLATSLVDQVSYWYGLFSHRRGTYAWKGFVQLPLGSGEDDVEARAKLLALLSGLQRKAG
nr:hypothetical protein [Myxococcus hansupus]